MLPVAGVATKGTAVSFSQYVTGVVTAGAAGAGVIVTVMGVLGPSQPPLAISVTWLT